MPAHKPAELQLIEDLATHGVHVASGSGEAWQKVLVWLVILTTFGLAIHFSVSDPIYLLILFPILLAIDFLSGFVHWFFDTQVKPSDTFLGRIAIDFLDHHVRPGRTTEVGFFVSAWRPALFVTLPLLAFLFLAPLPTWISACIFWIASLSMWVPQTQKEAHLGDRPAWISLLQRSRVIIHPSDHQKHHDDNHESFCVFTGWLNPILNRTRFWRGMEWLFATIRGQR